jgi:probable rRNA maturation factor
VTGGARRDVRIELSGLGAWPDFARSGRAVRRGARLALAAADPPPSGEISVAFVDADAMAELNRTWLDREGPTDVIAFDLGEPGPDGKRELVGDVYVCPDVAVAASEEPGGPPADEELVRLAIHGVLHVLGHDHPEDGTRWDSPMYRLQESLLARALEADAGEG